MTQGFLLTFLVVYIHIYDQSIINLEISNIMLANNICDMEDDLENKRYTLPIYIGKERELQVYKITYYIGVVSIVIGVATKLLPVVSLVA